MRFDDFWTDEDEQALKPGGDLPLLPDGEHAGTIVAAKEKDLKFMVKPENPRGTSLVLEVEVTGHKPVEAIIPAQMRWLVESVCRSASVHIPYKGEDWDPEVLVDRQVRVKTVYGIAKSGREYVRVEKWIKGPDPLPQAQAAKPPARTPAAKVEAAGQGGASDDIPFMWLIAIASAAISMGFA